MKLVCISDTHGVHRRLDVPPCDLLVHAGDSTRRGRREELEDFVSWFAEQPARAKVFVAGNHDWLSEREPAVVRAMAERHGLTYLEDESVSLLGLRIHGSPVTPTFRHMAWNRDRGATIRRHWEKVPEGLDLLVTHGPPHGIGDRTFLGMHVGCEELRAALPRIAPRFHVFGHIHEAHGEHAIAGLSTRFVNVASLGLLPFAAPRTPVVLEL